MHKLLGHSALALTLGVPAIAMAEAPVEDDGSAVPHYHRPYAGLQPAEQGDEAAEEISDEAAQNAPVPVDGGPADAVNIHVAPSSLAEDQSAEDAADDAVHVQPVLQGIKGRVVDAETGEPLIEATVKVVKGGEGQTLTDIDGNYELQLPPGNYQLRVFYPLYEGRKVQNVRVKNRRVVKLSLDLNPWSEAIEEIVVYAEPERQTEAGMLAVRKEATTVADTLSSQEMSRGGDSSAAGAVKRVVSVTVNDGKYVVLRGLGGRYVTTLLNGVTLPSPEPDKQAVPLDLFPTSLLSNLMVSKSYDPRNPGTFGGGTLMIETNTYPDEFTLKMKASTAANTATTLQGNPNYDGGSLDMLGFDDGTRALPGAVPTDRAARLSSEGMDAARLEEIGEAFANSWEVGEQRAIPNFGLGATVGDTVKHRGRDLGYLASLTYGHSLSARAADVAKVRNSDEGLQYREQLDNFRGTQAAKLGGLVSTGYEIDKDNRLNFFSLYTHNGQSSAQRVTGISEADGQEIDSTRMRFVERYLSFSQVQGHHKLSEDLELSWQGNLSLTSSDEPDTRDLTYNVLDDGSVRLKNETGSAERYFSELSQTTIGTGFDLKHELSDQIKLKAGAIIQHSERDFSARRFRFAFVGNDASVLFQGPESILSADNIGPSFRIEERTMPTDAYGASQTVMAGYSGADVEASDDLRLSAGLRYEAATQQLDPGSRFAASLTEMESVDRTDSDFLPGTSATYALSDDVNLRSAYSYTLARPQFREMAPFLFFDYTRRRSVSGNPDLVRTRIHNADLRWEWFPGDADVLAASVFYKKFKDPIEQVIVSASGGDVSFANAAGATTMGAELEAKMGLGHLNERLDNYKAWANLALINSEIELREEDIGSQTSSSRALQGQSPYVLNLGFGYSDKLNDLYALYNVSGKSIAEVGFDSLPDVYRMPFHRVDVSGSRRMNKETRLKFSATNLLNRSVRMEQGDLNIFRYKPGVGFSLSLEWTPQ